MGLFRRKQASPPDPHLTFLTVEQADRVRVLTREAFTARGIEVTIHPDHLAGAGGTKYGLWNVAASCAALPEPEWQSTVDTYVGHLADAADAPRPFDTMAPGDVPARTYSRLYDATALPDGIPHVAFAPGIVEVLALDLPDTLAFFHEEDVARFGGWAALQRHGRASLAREAAAPERLDLDGGGHVTAINDESVHTASRALLLPGLLTTYGDPPGDRGWFLTVPNRHQLWWHVPRDGTAVDALRTLVHLGLTGYSDGASPVSPHTYWWNGAEYRQLTTIHDDGRVEVHVDPELAEALGG